MVNSTRNRGATPRSRPTARNARPQSGYAPAVCQHPGGQARQGIVQAVQFGHQRHVGRVVLAGKAGPVGPRPWLQRLGVARPGEQPQQVLPGTAQEALHVQKTARSREPLAQAEIAEALEHRGYESTALDEFAPDGKGHVGSARQELPDLLDRAELCFVHIDHHSWMIDPVRSFQPPAPLEEAFALLFQWAALYC